MENRPVHPHQHGRRPQPPLSSAPATAPWHASSSVNAASIQMQSHPHMSSLCSADDGYSWVKSGHQAIPGWGCPTIYYECAHENCRVKKSVALSVDGQIVETVYRGSHNHPRTSEMLLRDVQAPFEPDSQRYVLPDVSGAGTSMRRAMERGAQLPFSTDTNDEEGDSEGVGADCELSIEANTTERHASVSPRRNTPFNSHRSERRSKSKVWEEFTAVLSDGKIQGAECKHCKKCLSAKSSGGTSHLHRHLKTCPAQPASARMQQLQSSSHLVASPENWTFDQDKSHELLTKALISNFCSFSLTRSVYFRQFLAGICPTYLEVSPGAIEEKFLRIFETEKLKLKDKLKLAPGRVVMSAIDWGLEFRAFICLTVHFIDREWKMNKKVIRCCFLGDMTGYDDSHEDFFMFPDWESYRKLFDEGAKVVIKEAIQEWSLEHKLLGIVSPNIGMISQKELLGDASILDLQLNPTRKNYLHANDKLFSLPCMLRTIRFLYPNLFIREISRDCFKYMTCSPLRREKYNEILSRVHVNRPSFGSNQSQWFYYILEAFFQFNKVLPNPEQMDSQSNPSKPSYEKLEAAETFCNLSRPIYHALKVFSDTCNETLNLQHFQAICRWKIALMGSSMKANINQVCDVERLQARFDELWRNWYPWLSLAVVLDPRYKIRFLDHYFKQAFGSEAKSYIYEVRAKIYELFFRYSIHAHQQMGEVVNDCIGDLQLDAQGHGSIPVHDTSYIEQSAHEEIGELIVYLEGDLIPRDVPFDTLKWWKANASTYPTLARLARDILAIPVSTVSAESVFDESDERESLFNKKMSPEVVEALICTQDWIKSSEIGDGDGRNRNISA